MPEHNATNLSSKLDTHLRLMLLANVTFATVVVFGWSYLADTFDGPIQWATWTPIGRNPQLLDYPFVLLWLLPLIGIGVAWLLQSTGARRLAMASSAFPLLYLATLVACFHAAPLLTR